MGFKNIKEYFKAKYVGVGEERIAVRTQGCWNCSNWSPEAAANLWWKEARPNLLNKAVLIAIDSPLGENNQTVLNIRKMVPSTDALITKSELGCCSKGETPDGTPVGDFIAHTYLCHNWKGAVGSSLAREGQKPDQLPEEILENTFGPEINKR